MPIRPANSVTVLQRRFMLAESGNVEPIELLSIHDELSRIERKWVAQMAERSERRKPGDIEKLNLWYERLQLLIERSLRESLDESVKVQLRKTAAIIVSRPPVHFTP